MSEDYQLSTPDLADKYGEKVCAIICPFISFGKIKVFNGIAVTVKCFEDNSKVKEVVHRAGHGKILVVDGGGSLERALLGDQLAKTAVENGWCGIVINGCVRDVEIIKDLSIGVLALGSVPFKTEKLEKGEIDVPISIGGQQINPGMHLFCDENGILVFPKNVNLIPVD
ncbi:putative 4-hydroxy-4-methyl-2-oxoglutarate aldolase [Bacteriovoracaceae bacterium]|nr:putative 4-hydroxy-4-methyl-2-oxoglutarate aldolase [Bacteriovoracaceae bacterium]